MRYEGEHFRDQRVQLDGNEFEGCRFTNVLFDYAGGPVAISGCRFEGFAWQFTGALGRGLRMLAQLYAATPAAALTQLSKALFPKPGGTKADHTAISFQVTDIGKSIAELKAAGVVFEDYDFPGLKTIEHVCVLGSEKAAWFKDSEGNYLCIHEDIAAA